MGRLHLSPNIRKSRMVSFRLTESQFMKLSYQAAASHQSVNDLARTLTLSKVQKVKIVTVDRCDPVLLKELHKIGLNLNQLTKNAHIFGRISPQVELLCHRINMITTEAFEKEEGI